MSCSPCAGTSVPNFRAPDETMETALALADSGMLLTPPIQPEVREMRRWLCQRRCPDRATGVPPSKRWSDPDVATSAAILTHHLDGDEVTTTPGQAVLAAYANGRIVVASPGACDAARVRHPAQLYGLRTSGDDTASLPPDRPTWRGRHSISATGAAPCSDHTVVVPFLRRDGSEVTVEMLVQGRRLSYKSVFVAGLRPSPTPAGGRRVRSAVLRRTAAAKTKGPVSSAPSIDG